MELPIAIFDGLGTSELIVVGVIAILLFGERLPDVARTWGKKFVEFKRSVQGIQDELRSAAFSTTSALNSAVDSATESFNSATQSISSATDSMSSSHSDTPDNHRPDRSGDGVDDAEVATAPKFEPPKFERPPTPLTTSQPPA